MAHRNKKLFHSPIALNLSKENGSIQLNAIAYNESFFGTEKSENWIGLSAFLAEHHNKTIWLNCYPPENKEVLEAIASHFDIDSFLWADAVDFSLRSKHWATEEHFFCSFKMKKPEVASTEHISFILGKNFIISLQEEKEDVFEHIRNRLAENIGVLRHRKADYLFFLLCDALVDQYTLVADSSENELLHTEEQLNSKANTVSLKTVFSLKQEYLKTHRDIRTANDVIRGVLDSQNHFITETTRRLFISISHNAQYCVDSFARQIEHTKSLSDLYFAQQNNRLNEMIKLLTIMSAVFIPISFIAGFYGMNFESMSELKYPWAYPLVISIMLLTSIGILFYFRRKKWL